MTSWQSRIVNPVLRARVSARMDKSVDELRIYFDSLMKVTQDKLRSKFPNVSFITSNVDGIPCERIRAAQDDKPSGTIIFIHGGGYLLGSIATHRRLALRLAWQTNCDVLTFDYRLAPEHPYPAASDDCLSVYQSVLQQFPDSKIFIGGDSAGGALTLATLFQVRTLGLRMPIGAFLISPWGSHLLNSESMKSNHRAESVLNEAFLRVASEFYCGSTDPTDPMISPVLGNFEGLPPLLIQASNSEVLLDDARAIEKCAKRDGVNATLEIWPKMPHAWHLFAHWIPEGKRAIRKIGEFVGQLV